MDFLIEEREGLASSANSSSDIIQRLISLFKGERGSIILKYSERESEISFPSSFLENALTLSETFKSWLKSRSSLELKKEPISSLFREREISFKPENEREPFCHNLLSASEVSFCSAIISS